MYLVGRTTGYGFNISDTEFAALRSSGMTVVEHSLAGNTYDDPRMVAEMAARHDVKVWSCHLPFRGHDASTPDKEESARIFKRYCEEIKKGAEAGIEKFVMHPGYPFADEAERPERLKRATDFSVRLADVAEQCGVVIAVEDMPHCIGNTVAEIEAIVTADPRLRVCFDVNHLLNNTHDEFIDRLGSKIVTVHFSDYDFVDERHLFPTDGKIDWVALIRKLYCSGYKGAWIYECNKRERTFQMCYDIAAGILKEAGVAEI